MQSLVIVIIFLSFIGIYINMGTTTEMSIPEFKKKELISAEDISNKLEEKVNESIEFDEMGNTINNEEGLEPGKEIINLKVNPSGSAPNTRPKLRTNASSAEFNEYGIKYSNLSYKNNFPYEEKYLEKVNSSNIKMPILNRGKSTALRSQIILPKNKEQFKEGYGFMQRAISIIKNHVENENKDLPYILKTHNDIPERGAKKIYRVNRGNLEVNIKPDLLQINNERQYNLNLDKEHKYIEQTNLINSAKKNYNFK